MSYAKESGKVFASKLVCICITSSYRREAYKREGCVAKTTRVMECLPSPSTCSSSSSKSEDGTRSSSGWCAIKLHRDCGRSGRYTSKPHSQCRGERCTYLLPSRSVLDFLRIIRKPACSLPLAIRRLLCWQAALASNSFSLPNERCQICWDHTR